MKTICIVLTSLLFISTAHAQADPGRLVELNLQKAPLETVVDVYGELIGKAVIKHPALPKPLISLNIPGQIPATEAAEILELMFQQHDLRIDRESKHVVAISPVHQKRHGIPVGHQVTLSAKIYEVPVALIPKSPTFFTNQAELRTFFEEAEILISPLDLTKAPTTVAGTPEPKVKKRADQTHVHLLGTPMITTLSGVNAQVEVVREIIYPMEFAGVKGEFGHIVPGKFETRETGIIFNISPTAQMGKDSPVINVRCEFELCKLMAWTNYGTRKQNVDGDVVTSNVPIPTFWSYNFEAGVSLKPGQEKFVGGGLDGDRGVHIIVAITGSIEEAEGEIPVRAPPLAPAANPFAP